MAIVRHWMGHVYVRVSGVILDWVAETPLETWSFGVRIADAAASGVAGDVGDIPANRAGPTELDDYLMETVEPAVRALFAGGQFPVHSNVSKISANFLMNSTSGSAVYANSVPSEIYPGVTAGVAAITGGGGSVVNVHPPQCTVVASLLTQVSRGRAHRGRIYMPPSRYSLSAQWGLATADAEDMAESVGTYLGALKRDYAADGGMAASEWRPAIISPLREDANGGTGWEVRDVAVGSVIDTQRRRRRSISETYSSFEVPAPA